MLNLKDVIPDPANLLVMDDETLGVEALEVLKSWEDKKLYQMSKSHFVAASLKDQIFNGGYNRPDLEEELAGAIGRAWDYLAREGYLIPERGYSGDVLKLSEKAKELLRQPKQRRTIANIKLKKDFLHQRLQTSAWNNYKIPDYETAVFAAMKAVEVAVREAAQLPNSLIGVPLMRKAFDPATGALTDMNAEGGEKQAMSDLFAGSIGSFKNPSSHRPVQFENADTAAEILMLANHLLRIVDVRKAANP